MIRAVCVTASVGISRPQPASPKISSRFWGRCSCRCARHDIKRCMSSQAAADGVAISPNAGREPPTCPAPYAVREMSRCARHDIKRCMSSQAAADGVAISLNAGREPPPALHRTQCGRCLAALDMTLTGICHCEPPQAAWQSPAKPLPKQCGISAAAFCASLHLCVDVQCR